MHDLQRQANDIMAACDPEGRAAMETTLNVLGKQFTDLQQQAQDKERELQVRSKLFMFASYIESL